MNENELKLQETLFLIKVINDKFEAKGNSVCNKAGLTLAQFRILVYLNDNKDRTVTQRELESFSQVSHPAVNGILKRMEEKNFISTKIVTQGKIQKQVFLEQKGLDAIQMVDEDHRITHSKLLEAIPMEDWNNIRSYLERILESL